MRGQQCSGAIATSAYRRFCRDYDLFALQRCERAPNDTLCSVGCRGIDEVDAEIDGFKDKVSGLSFRFAGFEAKAAEAPTAESGYTDTQLGSAEAGVLN